MWRSLYQKLLRKIVWTDRYLIIKLMGLLLIMMVLFTAVFYNFEEDVTLWDSLWTAYISLITVGYGDFAAKTWQGRLVTVLVTLFGVACLTLFAGTIIDKFMEKRLRKLRGESDYRGEGHIVIVNIPSYDEILELLSEIESCCEYSNIPRVIIASHLPENDKEMPERVMKRVDAYVCGIASSMDTLRRANIEKAMACLLMASISEPTMDDVNTLTAGIIEKNWPHVITILDCVRGDTVRNLSHFGIDGGVNSTSLQMGLLVQELKAPGTFDVYSQLASNGTGQQIYISTNPFSQWNLPPVGLTMGQLKASALTLGLPVTILGVRKRKGDAVDLNTLNDYNLQDDDRLIYMAEKRFDWLSRAGEIKSSF